MTYYHSPASEVPMTTALNCFQMDPSSKVPPRADETQDPGILCTGLSVVGRVMQDSGRELRSTSHLCPGEKAQSYSPIMMKAPLSECTVASDKP